MVRGIEIVPISDVVNIEKKQIIKNDWDWLDDHVVRIVSVYDYTIILVISMIYI